MITVLSDEGHAYSVLFNKRRSAAKYLNIIIKIYKNVVFVLFFLCRLVILDFISAYLGGMRCCNGVDLAPL